MKISEVCRLLNISRETIRFYEKSGMVMLEKNGQSGYGECSTKAFWDLVNMIGMRNLGFSIRESREIIRDISLQDRIEMFERCHQQLKQEIDRKQILSGFLHKQITELKAVSLNCGRYWFEYLPPSLWFPIAKGDAATYTICAQNHEAFGIWSQNHPFVRAALEIECKESKDERKDEYHIYYYTVEKEYAERLDLPICDEIFERPARIALCSIIDANRWGELPREKIEGFYEEMRKAGMNPRENRVFGRILCKANEEGQLYRFIKLETDIECE